MTSFEQEDEYHSDHGGKSELYSVKEEIEDTEEEDEEEDDDEGEDDDDEDEDDEEEDETEDGDDEAGQEGNGQGEAVETSESEDSKDDAPFKVGFRLGFERWHILGAYLFSIRKVMHLRKVVLGIAFVRVCTWRFSRRILNTGGRQTDRKKVGGGK